MRRGESEEVIAGTADWSADEADAIVWAMGLKANSINAIVSSSPYAMKAGRYQGLPGGFTPNDPMEWAHWMHRLSVELSRGCSGFICWVVDSPRKANGEYVPAVENLMGLISGDRNLVLCTPHVWTKNSPPGGKNYPGHSWEYVVVCHRRGATPHYNPDEIATPAKFTSGAFRQRGANGKRGSLGVKVQKGKPTRPRDVIHVTVGGRHMGRERPDGKVDLEDDKLACSGEAPFPWRLARRLIRGMSRPDDIVGDCFLGSGTTLLASVMYGRRFVGCDLVADNIGIAEKRMALLEQSLTEAA
jgi:hypothetical protein